MKNISMKKVLAILMIVLLITSFSSLCFAYGSIPNPNEFKGNAGNAKTEIMKVSNLILGVAQVIGVAVAVIMLVILGIKYISAAPSEKGEIKKSAIIYIFGAFLLFGGVAVLNIIQRAGNDISATTTWAVVNEQKSDIEVA